MWLNLVEHLLREQGIVGSNPATQTTGSPSDRDRFLHVWSSGFNSRTSYQRVLNAHVRLVAGRRPIHGRSESDSLRAHDKQ